MSFTSPAFLFFFAFLLYFYSLVPASWRIRTLLAGGLIWYGSWKLEWAALLFLVTLINYLLLSLGEKRQWWDKSFYFPSLLIANIIFLFGMKLLPFFGPWRTPLGISFFIFLMLSYEIDLWRKAISHPARRFEDFFLYVSFFPILSCGPLERYKYLSSQYQRLSPLAKSNIRDGVLIFVYGYFKNIYLSRALQEPVAILLDQLDASPPRIILGGLLSTMRAYVEFSSYCDMGRGMALCFGIQLNPEFKVFYLARTPIEFWQRWNITLGTWIRDYFLLPSLFHLGRWINRYTLTTSAFLIIGIWHGISANWMAFGLVNGLTVSTYMAATVSPARKVPFVLKGIGWGLTLFIFIANGILQHQEALNIIQAAWRRPSLDILEPFASVNWLALAPVFAIIFCCDFLQERKGKLDFFLDLPPLVRTALSISSMAILLYLVHIEILDTGNHSIPLYFKY